eukprot:GHVS01015386.1.p1 GENE.GHVS01015386.1~~GHVS01015386.1.p1  ORF type:complete len:119 (-),score=2.44 GHVS01015386.1:397-753(-)
MCICKWVYGHLCIAPISVAVVAAAFLIDSLSLCYSGFFSFTVPKAATTMIISLIALPLAIKLIPVGGVYSAVGCLSSVFFLIWTAVTFAVLLAALIDRLTHGNDEAVVGNDKAGDVDG